RGIRPRSAPPDAEPPLPRHASAVRMAHDHSLAHQERALAREEKPGGVVGAANRCAIQHRHAHAPRGRWVELDATTDSGVGKDRWPRHTALPELGADP